MESPTHCSSKQQQQTPGGKNNVVHYVKARVTEGDIGRN